MPHKSIKITKAKLAKWEAEHKDYNKLMKRCRLQPLTLDQYIDKIHGKLKVKQEFKPYVREETVFDRLSREHREKYPSVFSMGGSTAKKETMQYTGTLIKGIATMHKSNAVPIINEEQAKEISQMRRN
jgi:hypothetical protein